MLQLSGSEEGMISSGGRDRDNDSGDIPVRLSDIVGRGKRRNSSEGGESKTGATTVTATQYSGSNSRAGEDLQREASGFGYENQHIGEVVETSSRIASADDRRHEDDVRDSKRVSVTADSSRRSENAWDYSGVEDSSRRMIAELEEITPDANVGDEEIEEDISPASSAILAAFGRPSVPPPVEANVPKRKPGRPKKSQVVEESLEAPLTNAEKNDFVQAIVDVSSLVDDGLWYLGMDTDPDTPDAEGNPGIPIWTMTSEEAALVANSIYALAKINPVMNKAVRVGIQASKHFQAGVIVGSRFVETMMRIFETGINLRFSRSAWIRSVQKAMESGGSSD